MAWWVPAGAALLALPALAAAGWLLRNAVYADWDAARAARAGFAEHTAEVGGVLLNYAEGPANGPPLLLVHGQVTDWRSWHRVLPALSRDFHVFAVDCHGHGGSARVPERYTAKAVAADLEGFLDRVVGAPALVVGHSSGGLVAAVMAADAPGKVAGAVLEDPPLFSSVHPRAEATFNHVDLSTAAHGFLREGGASDFTDHYLRNAWMWKLFRGAGAAVRGSALRYRARHPGRPPRIPWAPPVLNHMFLAMDSYDPRFGEAFHDNSFHDGFDHAGTLARITVPTVLIHADWSYGEDGVLLAAMDGDDAARARSLIEGVEFHRVDSGHGFHFERPRDFVRIVRGFGERVLRRTTRGPAPCRKGDAVPVDLPASRGVVSSG
ncbi:alpha/beta fold hydrolase [Nocardiopsis sp. NPDC101807]|uniref:alpha/beta fold hydrolase n=1 Tax=Nocardiopsis sp. NPDC101807 TaxID=3364339 RepID=UPI0037F3DCC2